MKRIIIAAAVMMAAAGMCGAYAADTKDDGVVSCYEFSSVSYGNSQDGQTYHHVVTKHNGVVDTDYTTVNNGTALQDQRTNGVQLRDGKVIADGAELGGVTFRGKGQVTGVQTNKEDKTSAVSVAYLEEQIAQLQAEIKALKAKK